MPHECAYRSFEAEAPENAVLFCKIRTISSLEHLLRNISRTHFDDLISLHVQCSEILFFESTLATQTDKNSGKSSDLSKLRDLVIDKCKIRQIPARAFENFKDLKRLHVTTHNSEWSAMTMELHEQAFSGLNELIELDLSDNNIWSTKTETFFWLYSLKTLNLNQNHLQNIKTVGFSDSLREQNLSVDMNAFRLDQIDEDSDLPEFFISGNPFVCDCSMEWIQRINYLSHSRQYPRVLDLDKAYCSLVHSRTKQKKMIIDMSPSDFLCPYDSHCFALCHCCDFVACDCEMICPNNCKCYHDITWNANVVDCSNAGYTEVPERIPMDATEIYLDGNHISNLGNHVFIGKKKLQVLYLNNTKLKEVNNQTFKGVDSLRVLHLENNKLVELKGDEFLHLNNLNELYLDHNAIVHVANNTFSSLKSLSVLRIDDNKLVNFFPWKLLASSSKSLAHVSIEGNQYSCDCKSIAELDSWLRRDPGDPEKMLCTDSKGAIFYAFRYDVSDWLYTKYGVPLFKEQSCANVDILEGNPNHMYDYYYCKRNDGESSHNESSPSSDNNTYGEGNDSNNSYMSIDNRTCSRFNYDLRLSPSSGHVYSRVEDISPTTPRSITGSCSAKGRTTNETLLKSKFTPDVKRSKDGMRSTLEDLYVVLGGKY
ncbi:Slit-like 3 protein [Papilio xuthus]|uniref:Slit-like 3 protein n=1 Tax=Papilio xuthus TaxID=66420 RepID=A0A194PMA4_PAPXU|nr:Slit-like 3 protein [Papilio xuthus]